jgi:hypothetical protein
MHASLQLCVLQLLQEDFGCSRSAAAATHALFFLLAITCSLSSCQLSSSSACLSSLSSLVARLPRLARCCPADQEAHVAAMAQMPGLASTPLLLAAVWAACSLSVLSVQQAAGDGACTE